MSFKIAENDTRMMVRLLGETAALNSGHHGKKYFLMQGLCELVHADFWVWVLGNDFQAGISQIVDAGGSFSPTATLCEKRDFRACEKIFPVDHLPLFPVAQRLLQRTQTTSRLSHPSPFKAEIVSSIIICRHGSARLFSERETKIAHIILSEVPWLYSAHWPRKRGCKPPKLFPRQRLVLNFLIAGFDRKSIADQLDISENTVAGYAKDIYRCFDVHSQAQLMQKLLTGNSHIT